MWQSTWIGITTKSLIETFSGDGTERYHLIFMCKNTHTLHIFNSIMRDEMTTVDSVTTTDMSAMSAAATMYPI